MERRLLLFGMCFSLLSILGDNDAAAATPADSNTAPKIIARNIKNISGSSVTLDLLIYANQPTAVFWFQWGKDTLYGRVTPPQAFRGLRKNYFGTRVEYTLKGLEFNTTYHIRAVAANDYGITHDSDMVFTTLSGHMLPDIIILDADSITASSARLRFRCNPQGTPTWLGFEIRPAFKCAFPSYTSPLYNLGRGINEIEVSETVRNLIPGMTYDATVRGYAEDFDPIRYYMPLEGNHIYFTARDDSSSRGLNFALRLTTNHGSTPEVVIGIHSYATECFDEPFGESPLPPPPPVGATEIRLKRRCLEPRSYFESYIDYKPYTSPTQVDTYAVRFQLGDEASPAVLSWPNLNVAYGGAVTLRTPYDTIDMKATTSYELIDPDFETIKIYAQHPRPGAHFPSVILPDNTMVFDQDNVKAFINPNGSSTSTWFEWGMSMTYSDSSPSFEIGNGHSVITTDYVLAGLTPYKVYNVRAVAENSTGRIYSADQLVAIGGRTSLASEASTPLDYDLFQNYPNPFNPTTLINYELPEAAHVVLKVYNMLGQEVATLIDEMQQAGHKSSRFEAQTASGRLPSGIYIYRITAGSFTDVKKMAVVK